jgi:hypothetical protein
VEGQRTATVVIDDFTWWRFQAQFEHKWVDWTDPRFIGEDLGWQEFLETQLRRYPELPGDLPVALQNVDNLWILRQSFTFDFVLAYDIPMRSV